MIQYVLQKFTGIDPVSILYFLPLLAKACNKIGIKKCEALWALPDFLDNAARKLVLNMLSTTTSADDSHTDVTYIRVVDELLQNYATVSSDAPSTMFDPAIVSTVT